MKHVNRQLNTGTVESTMPQCLIRRTTYCDYAMQSTAAPSPSSPWWKWSNLLKLQPRRRRRLRPLPFFPGMKFHIGISTTEI